MSATLLEKAPAKDQSDIAGAGRRADGYHELESLVAFADVADTLTLQPVCEETGLRSPGPSPARAAPVADNLVLKALAAMRERIAGTEGWAVSA